MNGFWGFSPDREGSADMSTKSCTCYFRFIIETFLLFPFKKILVSDLEILDDYVLEKYPIRGAITKKQWLNLGHCPNLRDPALEKLGHLNR